MESKHVGALALVILGASLLLRNLNFWPRPGVTWPVILIILGILALLKTGSRTKRYETSSGEVIWEVDGSSPLFKAIVAIPAIFVALIIGLIFLGFLAPFFLVFLLFIPFILFIKLGWAFLRLLIPIAFAAAPLLLIIFLLALIF